MKRIPIILFLAFMAFQCTQKPSESSTTAEGNSGESEAIAGLYGAELSGSDLTPVMAFETALTNKDEKEVKLKVKIDEVCQMKGCWMNVDMGDGKTIRVTFKDYGFFVPKNAQGYTAIIEGTAKVEITDVQTLKHYAQDAGKSAEEINSITEPSEEINFVATGVLIES
ncbi:MAG: DUF4920 domain-containing protein [Cyclobacteriaceae bacterium]|nr:DUF4920 domain-containing protein [Cyclobacteriaceae bacterium]